MENEKKNIKPNISKTRMTFKIIRLWAWSLLKRKWYLPEAAEITSKELLEWINKGSQPLLIDLRDEKEFEGLGEYSYEKYGHISNSRLIPFFDLPSHIETLRPHENKEIVTICQGGGASLVAVDIMVEAGYTNVKSLKGGIKEWHKNEFPLIRGITFEDVIHTSEKTDTFPSIADKQTFDEQSVSITHSLDARGLVCPHPILRSKKKLKSMKIGQVLEILTTDPGSKRDIPAWAHVTGNKLLISEECGSSEFRFLVKRIK